MADKTKKALILLAHGSRAEEATGEMQALADRMSRARPGLRVRGAFLSLTSPDLDTAVREAVADGAGEVAVLPLFLFSGKHVLEDIPARMDALRNAYPDIRLALLPAIGGHPGFPDFLLDLAGTG